jgi:hypothetical protein
MGRLLGGGKKLFDHGTVPAALRLAESVTYSDGTVHLAYEADGAPTTGPITG